LFAEWQRTLYGTVPFSLIILCRMQAIYIVSHAQAQAGYRHRRELAPEPGGTHTRVREAGALGGRKAKTRMPRNACLGRENG